MQRAADRLAWFAWRILLVSVALALLGGVADAAGLASGVAGEPRSGLRALPAILPLVGYLLAIALGLPSLLAGVWAILHGRWATGVRRLLTFAGPVLFFVGTEVVPHALDPCGISGLLDRRWGPGLCQYSPEWGASIADRWHALDHALIGALPMVALYRLALDRWRPAVAGSH